MESRGLTANGLKLIAVTAMLFDHVIAGLFSGGAPLAALLRIPGRITAPIMCYMIAEGYSHTSSRRKYAARLLVFAAISHLPYNLYFGYSFFEATSVMWSLALGLVALTAVKCGRLSFSARLLALLAALALALRADWNYIAVLWVVAFGVFSGKFMGQAVSFAAIGTAFYIVPAYPGSGMPGIMFFVRFGIFLAIPLLAMYNGRRGRKSKLLSWAFYVFYPAHLLVLYFIKLILYH